MLHRLLGLHKTLGIIFVVLLLVGVWLTYAVFTKKFADYDEVTMRSSSIGLQLPQRADVKIRGVIVGEVLETRAAEGGRAELVLGLYPDQVDTIPKNVEGAIVPKTLFGEKYVSLEIPNDSATEVEAIQAGDVIEKSALSTEVEKVLSDLYPLLRTVQPADLNLTLNALATALEGRGEALGENLETLDSYLKRINPRIPQLLDDLRLAAEVSDIYSDILPEVATILDNTVKTTGTLEGREEKVNKLLRDVGSFADTAGVFLNNNDDLIERFAQLGVKQLRVLAKYSPEFPCVTEGLVKATPRLNEAFRNYVLHIVLEFLPHAPPAKWAPKDAPRIGETRGPTCATLPNPPFTGQGDNFRKRIPNFNDGVDEPTTKGTIRVAPGEDPTSYQGTAEDIELLRELMKKRYGDDAGSDLGVLLGAPLATGGGA